MAASNGPCDTAPSMTPSCAAKRPSMTKLAALARTGGVVVSGDLYHYPAERAQGKMPAREYASGTPQSRKKIDEFLARTHSQLWISHSIDWYRDAVKAPGWYD